MKNKLCILLFISALTIVAVAGCAKKSSEPVIIHGSTTIEPVLVTLAEAFEKKHDINIQIEANGSRKGIRDLIEGRCNIADSSYRITPSQKKDAEKEGVKIREFHLAYDIIAPIVHRDNGISSIPMEQLQGIYTGKITTWEKIGWEDIPVIVVTRDENSGTFHVWKNRVLQGQAVRTSSVVGLSSNSSVLAYVAENRNAIGYISHAFINSEVKPLAVNGIEPAFTEKNKTDFPVRRKLYVYVDMNNLCTNTKKFLLYILSTRGQKIIEDEGFIPGAQYKGDRERAEALLSTGHE